MSLTLSSLVYRTQNFLNPLGNTLNHCTSDCSSTQLGLTLFFTSALYFSVVLCFWFSTVYNQLTLKASLLRQAISASLRIAKQACWDSESLYISKRRYFTVELFKITSSISLWCHSNRMRSMKSWYELEKHPDRLYTSLFCILSCSSCVVL